MGGEKGGDVGRKEAEGMMKGKTERRSQEEEDGREDRRWGHCQLSNACHIRPLALLVGKVVVVLVALHPLGDVPALQGAPLLLRSTSGDAHEKHARDTGKGTIHVGPANVGELSSRGSREFNKGPTAAIHVLQCSTPLLIQGEDERM